MFDVIKYGLNEYGEIIMQHFASSDNHRRLEIVLHMLKFCSLSPSFALSYVTGRYRHLLECILLSLTNYLEDHEPSDENVSSLLIILLNVSITFPNSIESIIAAIDIIDDDLNDNTDIENMVVSIDFECPIYDFFRVKGKISVAQIENI